MKEINYKDLIDKKLSRKTKEEDGTAYIAVDGQYEEQNGYGYAKTDWITVIDNANVIDHKDDDTGTLFWFSESPYTNASQIEKVRLIISGDDACDLTFQNPVMGGINNKLYYWGNPYLARPDDYEDNGQIYCIDFYEGETGVELYRKEAFTSDNNQVTVMIYAKSIKTIDQSLIGITGVFEEGEGQYSIRAKNNSSTNATGDFAVAEGCYTTASEYSSHAEGNSTTASGNSSHAEGNGTTASGNSSHAEGSSTTASGRYSHAEGSSTIASGDYSHAEGQSTIAQSTYSHAEGNQATASSWCAHAEGNLTTASGTYSHAEGNSTTASGNYSHAEGKSTIASGSCSHAEGENTIASGSCSHAEGGDDAFQTIKLTSVGTGNADYQASSEVPAYYCGKRITLMTSPPITTYITSVYGTSTDSRISVAASLGTLNKSSCNVMVGESVAYSNNTHAEGSGTSAYGRNSHAEGEQTVAKGIAAHSEGSQTIASVDYSHAEGIQTKASKTGSHAEGNQTVAMGNNSHVEGNNTYTGNDAAHAEGYLTRATGKYSHAEGEGSDTENSTGSHAEGCYTRALGQYSHAENMRTVSEGGASHAEGYFTRASGSGSHAEGGGSSKTSITLTGSGTSYTTTNTLSQIYLGKAIIYDAVQTIISAVDVTNKTIQVQDTLGTLDSASCGIYSLGTIASGISSHAEGLGTTASAQGSHSEGYQTIASEQYSHAEGDNTIASGYSASAKGHETTASGWFSHAEGYQTIASGQHSHAEGNNTIASGNSSHAEGNYNVALGQYSHAEGGDSGSATLIKLTSSDTPYTYSYTDTGYKHDWLGKIIKYEGFTARITAIDVVSKILTLDTNIGELTQGSCSLYLGGSSAQNDASHAEGYGTITYGKNSHAEGSNTITNGVSSHAEGNHTHAYGLASHAEGDYTVAIGNQSHAEGCATSAFGVDSHAEGGWRSIRTITVTGSNKTYTVDDSSKLHVGYQISIGGAGYNACIQEINNNVIKVNRTLGTLDSMTCWYFKSQAYGQYSHVEGVDCEAQNTASHAEGYNTIASGLCSHAEGYQTIASGQHSHAEGVDTRAIGTQSHSEGRDTEAIGNYSHSEGYGNTACGLNSHSEGSITNTESITLSGSDKTYTYSSTLSELDFLGAATTYNGNRCYITYINPTKKTITLSSTIGTQDGSSSITFRKAVAAGQYSHSEGTDTRAYGSYSHSEGWNTLARGLASHSEGGENVAYDEYSHAEGYGTITYGKKSHAEGNYSIARGTAAHAEGGGNDTEATVRLIGSGTTYTVSSGSLFFYYIGKKITYSGLNAFITSVDTVNKTITVDSTLGELNQDSYSCSIEIRGTLAQGKYSHSEGQATTSRGESSHAEGSCTVSVASYSHAEGYYSVSNGYCSHAEGNSTIASGKNQHTAGKYNIEDTNNTYAEIIGIGTSDSARANGRTLDWSGNEQLAGSLTLGLGTTDETTITATQLKQLLALLNT